MPSLKERVRTLPREPGCYLWKDAAGRVLYVGKASDLRQRTAAYLGTGLEPRIARMMAEAADLDFLAAADETEALILEQSLIKRHRPPYNVMMADDKRYPYIAVTREAWPRVVYTRDLGRQGQFFGPFPDAGSAKRVARLVNRTFKLRQCRVLPTRECLYYHLGQCTAPCIDAVSAEAYTEQAAGARAFLSGRGTEAARTLRRRMTEAAAADRFEEAAELRDAATAIDSVMRRQYVGKASGQDVDAIGLAVAPSRACAVVLPVRDGTVVGKEHYFLTQPEDVPGAETLRAFLAQYYTEAVRRPGTILVAEAVNGPRDLEAAWSAREDRKVRLAVPARGAKRRWVDLATKNAALLLEQELRIRERSQQTGLAALADVLGLPEPPQRIEGFDVSHHKGEHTVASLVALMEGRPDKASYRRFRIRTTEGGDDPGALAEAVQRRYRRLLDEEGADALPDLIVVDGGRPQVEAARRALASLGLEGLALIGLAKRLEEVHRPGHLHPLRLDRTSPALHVLQRLRDEAHRFAVAYQDRLTRKALTRSALDGVPGVGPARRRTLLRTFGSVEGVRRASAEALSAVPGIGPELAERIRQRLGPPSGDGDVAGA